MNTPEAKNNLMKHPWIKNILSALVVAAAGFVLLNFTFLFYVLVFKCFDIFVRGNPGSIPQWIHLARAITFVAIIALISWLMFRSKLPLLVKATFMTVPTATVLVFVGIFTYPSAFLPYMIGGLLVAGVLFYFYRTHKPWLYFYSVTLVALTLMVFTLTGGEI